MTPIDGLTLGVVALARKTFDVPFAEAVAARCFDCLDRLGCRWLGPRHLLFDEAETRAAIAGLQGHRLDRLVVLQVTFTDASMTTALAAAVEAPVLLWAVPEARSGGRLRLNSLCGLNLAAHALGKSGRPAGYLFADPCAEDACVRLRARLAEPVRHRPPSRARRASPGSGTETAATVLAALDGARIGRVGDHPVGFDTCVHDGAELRRLTGIIVEPIELEEVFAGARAVPEAALAEPRARAASLAGCGQLDPAATEKTLRSYAWLRQAVDRAGYGALAVRCWPEFFTDLGCAACGALAMLGEDGIPCACEADTYGAVTTLMLQHLAEEPVFIADLVDIAEDGTGVFWHCGLAPLSLADPEVAPAAALHSNRKMPLLGEFPLRPGHITLARLSQAWGETKLVLGSAEMIRAPISFSGTSGVARFDRPTDGVLDLIIAEGLEHHYALAYGDHVEALTALAAALDIPVLRLC